MISGTPLTTPDVSDSREEPEKPASASGQTGWKLSAIRLLLVGLVTVAGAFVSFTVGQPFWEHSSVVVTDLQGGQPWEESLSRQRLGRVILSQLKGGAEDRWWVHFVQGISYLPMSSRAERLESFAQASSQRPEQTESWMPTRVAIDEWYLQFLLSLADEAEKRGELKGVEKELLKEARRLMRLETRLPERRGESSALVKVVENRLEILLTRLMGVTEPREVTRALEKALPFRFFGDGMGWAFFTEPPFDLETDPERLGELLYSYKVGDCEGTLAPVGADAASGVAGRIEALRELRQFVIHRPWMDEALLERHRGRREIGGHRFFGPGAPLHLIPSHVISLFDAQFMVNVPESDRTLLAGWIEEGRCCEVVCGEARKILRPESVVLRDGRLAGRESTAKPEIFAVVSRRY